MSDQESGSDKAEKRSSAETLNPKCRVCGHDLMEFRTGGRLGCPVDYGVFGETLAEFFMMNQSACIHVGKWPMRGPSRFEVLQLRADLREAISGQNYEVAAKIRDRLREMTEKRKVKQ